MAFPIKKASFQWQDYLRILIRRRWYFTVPAVVVFVAICIWSLFLPRVYKAHTLIHVEEEKIINPLISDLAVSASVSSRLDTLREEILSWPRLVELVTKLDMAQDVRSKIGFEKLILNIRKRIEVNMRGNNLIKIAYEDPDPYLAQRVVQTISDVFIEANLMSQTQESQVAIDFIRKQLSVYEQKLEGSEKIHGLFEIRAQLEELERDRRVIEEQMAGQRKVIISEVTTQANPVSAQLRQRLASLELELTTVLADSTEAHPRVIMLRREIDETRTRLQQETESIVASEKSSSNPIYQALDEKLKDVEVTIQTLKDKEASLLPEEVITESADFEPAISQHDLATAARNTRVNEQIYAMLLNKLETAHITERLEVSKQGTRFHILEPARLPLRPIKPNLAQILLFGLFAALACGAAGVVVIEMFDHSVHNQEEAKLAININFLGAIPKIVTDSDRNETVKKRQDVLKQLLSPLAGIKKRIPTWS